MCEGRRVPITKSEFQLLCDLHDEGTFMAQCRLWHIMEKKLVVIQDGGPDLFDEINKPSLYGSENLEGRVTCKKQKIRFFGRRTKQEWL